MDALLHAEGSSSVSIFTPSIMALMGQLTPGEPNQMEELSWEQAARGKPLYAVEFPISAWLASSFSLCNLFSTLQGCCIKQEPVRAFLGFLSLQLRLPLAAQMGAEAAWADRS